MDNYRQLWKNILKRLNDDLGDNSFNEVFKECDEIYKFENNYLFIIVPSTIIKFRIDQFYIRKIRDIAKNEFNSQIGFKFITKKEISQNTPKENMKIIVENDSKSLGRNLSTLYRFENFVVGESNRYAYITASKVAENGVLVCNPLYIFGDVGLGKTHLMTSIGNFILDNNINTNVVYTSSQKFAEDYFLATSNKNGREKIEEFYNKYNNADVLLVDDIQFFEGKKATQEEFFKIFEHLVSQNKQIVLTSDRPANSLKNIMSRLQSRFSWGISVDIKQPDEKLLLNILKNKLSFIIEEPSDVPDEVLTIIANCFPNNIRDLEGALRTFINYCVCMNCPFTKENLYIALENLIPKNYDKKDSTKSTISEVIDIICSYYAISSKDLLSSSRKQKISYARQMLMYILRINFNIPLQTIGDNLGSRDHATVTHGIDKISELIKKDNLTKNDYEILSKKINF